MFLATQVRAGLPHGQEKSGKTKKNDKSQVKLGVFEKSHKFRKKFIKNTNFFSSTLPNSLYLKAIEL